jgi:branched-subunit amino acid aminotransferase/4-amino-4-deoxychorismate lyase
MLSFQINGKPIVHELFKNDNIAKLRIADSAKYMNIDYPTFNEERELLYQSVKKIVKEADDAYRRFVTDRSKYSSDKITFNHRIEDLVNMQDASAPYSRAAQEYIRSFRNFEWIDKYVVC